MATKSPGIYFHEIDNTKFQNMQTTQGTTVAVVGYAERGPIGVPVELTSYNAFREIFGNPIAGQYSEMAIRNVFASKGKVLFERVADATSKSKSNVVIKNGQKATDGKMIINSTENIFEGTVGYDNEKVYICDIIDTEENKKRLTVRAPESGKLTQARLFDELSKSLKETKGYDEIKVKTPRNKIYSFNLKSSDEINSFAGPYFINMREEYEGEKIAEEISKRIVYNQLDSSSTYSNPYCKYYVVGVMSKGEESVDSSGSEEEYVMVGPEGKVFKKEDAALILNGKQSINLQYTVTMNNNATQLTASFQPKLGNDFITFGDFAEAWNKDIELNTDGVLHVKFIEGDLKTGEDGQDIPLSSSYFLIYSTEKENFNIKVNVDENYKLNNQMFRALNDETAYAELEGAIIPELGIPGLINESISETNLQNVKEDEFKGFVVAPVIKQSLPPSRKSNISVEYVKETNSIKLINNDKVGDEELNTIVFTEAEDYYDSNMYENRCKFGDYIFDEESGAGKRIATLFGEKGIDINISRNIDTGKIEFSIKDSIDTPKLESSTVYVANGEYIDENEYKNLKDLIGEVVEEDPKDESVVAVYYEKGKMEVKDGTRDIVIFEAKEYGSGTTNISVEVETLVSPLDESKTHNIKVYVGGNIKESFENVSYNMKNERYFEKLINESPENGGSSYIFVKVVKNDPGLDVELKDSIEKSQTGLYTIGSPLTLDSVQKTKDMNEKRYVNYDYAIGNNGILTGIDADELFIEALDPEGLLANQDLFDFHVLITPDNINEAVQNAGIALCEHLAEGIYIADPPIGLSKKGVIDWHNGKTFRNSALTSTFAATYWPWLQVYDSTEKKNVWVMPSVVMAAQYVKVDESIAPWYAPAGETYGNISAIDIETYPNRTDRDELYVNYNRVNPFLRYNDGTILAYGEKTTQRINSTLTKIHTRRMLTALKKEVRGALRGFIFLPTIADNLNTIRAYISTIMEKYKIGGGISSYVVDTSMNTAATLQQDIFYVAVKCVPNGCLEQIEISFTLDKGTETVTTN